MRHTSIDLEQQADGERGLASEFPQSRSRSLTVLPGTGLISTASPMPPVRVPDRTILTQPAPHTECQCPRCRRRRVRRKGRRKGKTATTPPPTYIEAEIITVTTWTDDDPRGRAAAGHPLAHETSAQGQRAGSRWPGRRSRRIARWQVSLIMAALLALVFLSGLGTPLLTYLFPPPAATVAIIPSSSRESMSINVPAVVGPASANQVPERLLRGSSPTRTVVARASGAGQTPAQVAQGALIFYNQGPSPQTIGAGVSLTGADGIAIVTDGTVTVPAGNPPTLGTAEVGAHSVQAGSQANIAAGDISELCCVAGISVKNTAFSGGRDAQTYPLLEQHDLDNAAATVERDLTQQAQHRLQGQVSGREQLALGPECHVSVAAPPAGSRVAQTTLSVSAECTGEAFDRVVALGLAASLFAQEAAKQLGPSYRLASRITTRIAQAALTDARRGTLTISVQAQGTWRYQWSRGAQLAIARRIEGKSVQSALSMLAEAPGVAHTSISLSAGAQQIPTDPARITIVIMPVG